MSTVLLGLGLQRFMLIYFLHIQFYMRFRVTCNLLQRIKFRFVWRKLFVFYSDLWVLGLCVTTSETRLAFLNSEPALVAERFCPKQRLLNYDISAVKQIRSNQIRMKFMVFHPHKSNQVFINFVYSASELTCVRRLFG